MLKKLIVSALLFLSINCMAANTTNDPIVLLKTNLGNIEVQLNTTKAPITSANFLHYVTSGFYNGTIFHRVIPNFMIQGGGFTQNMQQKPTQAPIENEATNGLENLTGTIAMARTSNINSATSQFFINLTNNQFLDHSNNQYGYAVFGKVIKGMNIVDKIAAQPTESKGAYADVPVTPIIILSAEVMK